MAHTLHDDRLVVQEFGSVNMGATCYFNALFQALFSCTSLSHIMIELKSDPNFKDDPIVAQYYRMLEINFSRKIVDKKGPLSRVIPGIWKSILAYAQTRKDRVKLNQGQQCAGEGFHLFMESMDASAKVQTLFTHTYRREITCEACDSVVATKKDPYCMFEVHPTLEAEQLEKFEGRDDQYKKEMPLNDFLKRQNGYIEGYRCPNCGDTGHKFSTVMLTMVPEILVILSKKYQPDGKRISMVKGITPFPEKITFDGYGKDVDDPKTFRYEAVAQVEHSGSLSGGHYWAVCRRKGGWFTLNDSGVSAGKFAPTENTYMVFYNIMSA